MINESNKKKDIHLLISGRVTKVGFRNFIYSQAVRLGITGWTRNTKDYQVEAVLSGTQTSLEKMLKLLRKGPPGSIVKKLEKKAIINQELSSFEIRY